MGVGKELYSAGENIEAKPKRLIPQEEVRQIAQEIGNFYHLPSKRIKRVAEKPVEIVSKEEIVPLLEAYVQHETRGLNFSLWEISLNLRRLAEEKAKNIKGITFPSKKKGATIYIIEGFQETDIIRHEIIHALCQTEDDFLGFPHYGSYHPLEEAMAELLNVCQKERISLDELIKKILNEEIEIDAYTIDFYLLLKCLHSARKRGKPIAIQEIADYFFGREERLGDKGLWFYHDLQQQFPEKNKKRLISFLDYLCFGIMPPEDTLREFINSV